MSEWTSVLLVFWALWAIDGVRFARRRTFSIVGGGGSRHARVSYSRWSWPGWWPGSWRITSADVPLSLSPLGICNRPSACAGRPAETPRVAQMWRWSEIREVTTVKGWLWINGRRFCPDTGHIAGPQVMELARLPEGKRERKIRTLMRAWLRPAQVRRRVRVLVGRTTPIAIGNACVWLGLLACSGYVVADFAARLPRAQASAIAGVLPAVLGGLLALHVIAVALAWRALKRLKVPQPDRRGSGLASALLLPPQALRLRTLLSEGYFPPQHPLALALAFGGKNAQAEYAFQAVADMRWPIHEGEDGENVRAVTTWFRASMEQAIQPLLREAKLDSGTLLAPPRPDAPSSCSYCPRCRDQFVAGPETCPHGVPLASVREGDG